MSNRKLQEDLRRIVGIGDDGKRLDDQDNRETIPLSRGVSYFTPSGGVSSSNNSVPKDVEDDQADQAGTGSGSAEGSPGTTRNNKYCADGSIRPYSTGLCPEDIEAATQPYDQLGVAVTNGTSVDRIGGLYDCTNGDSVRLSFGFDGLPPEGSTDAPELIVGEDGLPILDENGEAQYTNQAESGACIPPPGWDSCDCYQREKRGGLKDGWDSVQAWHEAVNCAPDPFYKSEGYAWYGRSWNYSWTAAGHSRNEVEQKLRDQVNADPLSVFNLTIEDDYTDGGWTPYTGWPATLGKNGWEKRFYGPAPMFSNERFQVAEIPCGTALGAEFAAICGETVDPADYIICDQYYEPCENGATDDESCMPLELLQEEQCCEPYPFNDSFYTFEARYPIDDSGTLVSVPLSHAKTMYEVEETIISTIGCNQFETQLPTSTADNTYEGFQNDIYSTGYSSLQAILHPTCKAHYGITNSSLYQFFAYYQYSCFKYLKGSSYSGGLANHATLANQVASQYCGSEFDVCDKKKDSIQDYTVSETGITPNPSDSDIPQEQAEATSEKKFCNGNGDEVTVKPGLNGGTVILNPTADGGTGINYYRDPTTGKISFFSNSQIENYVAQ